MRRRWLTASVLVLVGLPVSLAAAYAASPPSRIPLPNGFQPEGISIRHGNSFYVGSLPTGAIYKADAETGAGSVLVTGRKGRSAVGLKVAHRRLYVAGGETGRAYVYDARSGNWIATYRLAQGGAFINDVVLTKDAAWFTDSVNPVLYRLPLGPKGRPRDRIEKVPLSGAIRYRKGFNVNGIEATRGGDTLVIVQSNTGFLFKVDADSGKATRIDLGGEKVVNGDGLLLDGRRLFVGQNAFNRVAVVDLKPGLKSGDVVRRLWRKGFDVPTTIADTDGWLYVVNARFSTPPKPSTKYWVTVLPKPSG
jgi:hypothetical protein